MAAGPMMGSPVNSPKTDTAPGIARPSQMLPEEAPTGGSQEAEQSTPDRQLSQVMVRTREIETQMEQLASTYPAAAPNLRKAQNALREAVKQIAATASGQEPPNPRMLG